MFDYADMNSLDVFFRARKLSQGGNLLWVRLLGVEVTLKGEFMAILISQKSLLLYNRSNKRAFYSMY